MAGWRARRRRARRRPALRRGLDQPRRGRAHSASTPRTCSASGTGSAAATRWTRRSGSRRCSRSARTRFRELLAGFHALDEHFRTAPPEQNLPVLMGLLGVWNATSSARARSPCCPYDQYLKRFPAYLQQLTMESNGKSVRSTGRGRLRHRPRLLGRARDERPAQLLPADPPGHADRPVRPDRLQPHTLNAARQPPRSPVANVLRPGRGARLREDGRRGRAPRARRRRSCPTASSRATGRRASCSRAPDAARRSARSSRSTSTASSRRAWCGG